MDIDNRYGQRLYRPAFRASHVYGKHDKNAQLAVCRDSETQPLRGFDHAGTE